LSLVGTSTTSTTKTLIVALWSVDTQAMQHLTLDARWDALKKCVEYAHDVAKGLLGGPLYRLNQQLFALFVAPEYLMARPVPYGQGGHSVGHRRHIDEDQKDIHLSRHRDLSYNCKGMLLVPGTIAWRKPLERSGSHVYHMRGNHPQWGYLKTESRYDKAMLSVRNYMERQKTTEAWKTWTADPLDRPVSGPLSSGRVAPTTQQKLNALHQAKYKYLGPDEAPTYIARNTAYVLLDGDVLFKYHKQGDFHEVLVGKDTVHIPGKLDGRFSVLPTSPAQRTIDFGLEICLDHAGGAVERDIKNMGLVDVHIITSAKLPTREANVATRSPGYLVHASSSKAYTGVVGRGKDGTLGDVKPIWDADNIEGSPLQLYRIELDVPLKTETSLFS
jgi:hypothetical protein